MGNEISSDRSPTGRYILCLWASEHNSPILVRKGLTERDLCDAVATHYTPAMAPPTLPAAPTTFEELETYVYALNRTLGPQARWIHCTTEDMVAGKYEYAYEFCPDTPDYEGMYENTSLWGLFPPQTYDTSK